MKKFLLIFILSASVVTAKAQMAFNEVYARPGNGQSEFIEIYNNAKTNVNINLDCFSALTYWRTNASTRGWYVLDFGPTAIPPGGYFTAAAAGLFNTQSQTGVTANLDWNALPAGASLTKWQYDGLGGYTQVPIVGSVTDLIEDVNSLSAKNTILLFKQSTFSQGLVGSSNSNTLDAEISSLPPLVATTVGACASETFTFSGISGSPFLYSVTAATGNDNGYIRVQDGNCAPWQKSAPGASHTPNATNNNNGAGGASPYDGTITVSPLFLNCNGNLPPTSTLFYGVSAVTGAATLANAFPVKVEIFNDLGVVGQYDPGVDALITTNTLNSFPVSTSFASIAGITPKIIVLFTTANGCYDAVFARQANCIGLPVILSSFTAERKNLNVAVKWETSTEVNSRGFAIERNNGNGVWQEVGFVPSQAANGFSASTLSYQFTDANNSKTISQYRIRQVDLNDNAKLSDIRSVRGIDQKGGIILYPNPSNDGRINIVFEDRNVTRDVAVSDMGGRIVKQLKSISANSVTIDNLVSGMYTIRVSIPATGEQVIEKVIVNKH
jgi:hypothetical protein